MAVAVLVFQGVIYCHEKGSGIMAKRKRKGKPPEGEYPLKEVSDGIFSHLKEVSDGIYSHFEADTELKEGEPALREGEKFYSMTVPENVAELIEEARKEIEVSRRGAILGFRPGPEPDPHPTYNDAEAVECDWGSIELRKLREALEVCDVEAVALRAYLLGRQVERMRVCRDQHYARDGRQVEANRPKGGAATKKLTPKEDKEFCELIQMRWNPPWVKITAALEDAAEEMTKRLKVRGRHSRSGKPINVTPRMGQSVWKRRDKLLGCDNA